MLGEIGEGAKAARREHADNFGSSMQISIGRLPKVRATECRVGYLRLILLP